MTTPNRVKIGNSYYEIRELSEGGLVAWVDDLDILGNPSCIGGVHAKGSDLGAVKKAIGQAARKRNVRRNKLIRDRAARVRRGLVRNHPDGYEVNVQGIAQEGVTILFGENEKLVSWNMLKASAFQDPQPDRLHKLYFKLWEDARALHFEETSKEKTWKR
jgi:hypothetical protein